jgi:hypothetical protein
MIKPRVIEHDDVFVVRDDLFPGGTKTRFLPSLFDGVSEIVYASPAEGGAQTALATVASQLGKRATIFVAQRAQLHPRTLMAKRLGAQIVPVSPGYLNGSSAVWLRHTGSRTSDCSGRTLHWNTAGRSVVRGWFRRPGAGSSSSLARHEAACRSSWPRVESC